MSGVGSRMKFPVQGGFARKRRFWGYSDERKAGCAGGDATAGHWLLGLRENKDYGGMWTGERDIEI